MINWENEIDIVINPVTRIIKINLRFIPYDLESEIYSHINDFLSTYLTEAIDNYPNKFKNHVIEYLTNMYSEHPDTSSLITFLSYKKAVQTT